MYAILQNPVETGNVKKKKTNVWMFCFVFLASDLFCAEEVIEERTWPKTKNNETAVIDCTASGRQGTMKRKCNGKTWGEEVSLCVKVILNNVALQAKVCKSRRPD